jgi:MSHA biogenesis protein MshQ
VIQTLPDLTFAPGDLGRKEITLEQFESYPNARLRISHPAGAPDTIACSGDNFAIRPDKFIDLQVTDTNAETAGTVRTLDNKDVPGGFVHKAGRPFTVSARAVNGDGKSATTTMNYAGTVTAILTDCGKSSACFAAGFGTFTVGASFAAGQLNSNVATYSDVGSFKVELIDDTFANVDLADGSTENDRVIKSNRIDVGRFVPDHFAVELQPLAPQPSFAAACPGGNFTYVGQPFSYSTPLILKVTAQNFSNGTTANYAGILWRISAATLLKTYSAATGTLLEAPGGTDPAIAANGDGTGTLTFSSAGTSLSFQRDNTPLAPFNAEISLAVNVVDADAVAYASNPFRHGLASAGNGIAFDADAKSMRFGRLALRNANGSQLVPLRVSAEAQYWASNALGFVTNTADSCTSIANNNVEMSLFTSHLEACETAVNGAGALSAGRRTLLLSAPGSANDGSVLLTVNLGNSTSGTTCTTVGGGTVGAAGANQSYLQGRWTGGVGNYDQNPNARASFGTFKGAEEVIFIRENF